MRSFNGTFVFRRALTQKNEWLGRFNYWHRICIGRLRCSSILSIARAYRTFLCVICMSNSSLILLFLLLAILARQAKNSHEVQTESNMRERRAKRISSRQVFRSDQSTRWSDFCIISYRHRYVISTDNILQLQITKTLALKSDILVFFSSSMPFVIRQSRLTY